MDNGASPATMLTIASHSSLWKGGLPVNISTTVHPTLLEEKKRARTAKNTPKKQATLAWYSRLFS